VGLIKKGVPVSWPGLDLTRKEVTLLGSRNSTNAFPEAIALLASGAIHYPTVATRLSLQEGPAVFARLHDNPAYLHKGVFVTPDVS
jgi:L-gulonate 5-dehydrogenase